MTMPEDQVELALEPSSLRGLATKAGHRVAVSLLAVMAVLFAWPLASCGGGGPAEGPGESDDEIDGGDAGGETGPPSGDPGTELELEVFSNPFDPRLIGFFDEEGNHVLLEATKDEQGRPVAKSRTIVTPPGEGSITVEYDAGERPNRIRLEDGSGFMLEWYEGGLVHVRMHDSSLDVLVDEWVDSLSTQIVPAPSVPVVSAGSSNVIGLAGLLPEALGLSTFETLTIDIPVLNCSEQVTTFAADKVLEARVDLLGESLVSVPAFRFEDRWRATVPKDSLIDLLDPPCETVSAWVETLCALNNDQVAAAILGAVCAAHPLASVTLCAGSAVALAAVCLNESIVSSIVEDLCNGAATITDLFKGMHALVGQEFTAKAVASVQTCDGVSTRESETKTFVFGFSEVSLSLNGCLHTKENVSSAVAIQAPAPSSTSAELHQVTTLEGDGEILVTFEGDNAVQATFLQGQSWTPLLSQSVPDLFFGSQGPVPDGPSSALMLAGSSYLSFSKFGTEMGNLTSALSSASSVQIVASDPPMVVADGKTPSGSLVSATYDRVINEWNPTHNPADEDVQNKGVILPHVSGGYQVVRSEDVNASSYALKAFRHLADGSLVEQETLLFTDVPIAVINSVSNPSGAANVLTREFLPAEGGVRLRLFEYDGLQWRFGHSHLETVPAFPFKAPMAFREGAETLIMVPGPESDQCTVIWRETPQTLVWKKEVLSGMGAPLSASISESGAMIATGRTWSVLPALRVGTLRAGSCEPWYVSDDPTLGGALPAGSLRKAGTGVGPDGRFVLVVQTSLVTGIETFGAALVTP